MTEQLDEGVSGKLTLVCAPAGFGKTTLLSEWVLRSEFPVGWLSLDGRDNDPTRFLSYVVTAIQTVVADTGEDALSLLRSPQPVPIQVVLTALVNELAAVPHDLALVLDDYHVIDDEAVHAAVAFLLEHLPPQMHLIVASRTDLPLALSRLLAGGNLTRLSDSDLQFTPEEAAAFLNDAMGLELSPESVAALEKKTEGWIAGLQLAALSLRGREDVSGFISAFAGTNREVFDYLAEEVLDRQLEDTRTFLLQTSILDRLSGPLCDAVTSRGDAQTMLEKLEGANLLLVPLDDQRRWYRYHHLFSDFLRERLRRDYSEMVSELHLRASVWHEANGTRSEAIGHAVASGDFERAGAMIERVADSMVGRGDIPTLERLLEALPEEVIRSRPRLYLRYVVVVVMVGDRWDEAERAFQDIEESLGLGGLGVDLSSQGPEMEDEELARIAGFVATGRANIAYEGRGDLPSAIALNRRALRLLANDESGSARGIAAGNLVECLLDIGDLPAARAAIDEAIRISRARDHPAEIVRSLCMVGRLQAIQGRLSEARKTYEWVLRLTAEYDEAGLLREAGEARVVIGGLLFERNDLEEATRYLLEGIELALQWVGLGEATSRLLEDAGSHDRLGKLGAVDADSAQSVVPGYIALARVRYAQEDTEGAFETLQMVEQVGRNSRVSPLRRNRTVIWVEAWRARLQMAEGNLGAADRWARERGLSAQDEPEYSPESEPEYLTLARLLMARGKHEEASSLLQWLLEDAEAGGRGRTVIEVLVLKALALRAKNNERGALGALRKALVLAEPEGYVRTFADEGAPMADLLRRLIKAQRTEPLDIEGDVPLEYVGKLLEALGTPVTAPSRVHIRGPAELVLDPITERELEVLKLLDTDLSNREIAARLFVSLATVKTHIKHLYRKLGVTARHQAVARAKELRLL